MRQLVRGERALLSDLAAINHLWDVELSVDAPFYIVDFCCLGLDENGALIDDDFVIHLNRPDAPRGAIQLNNASNNGAVFSLALEQLPPDVRRLVFTASVGENPLPGGLVGAAFSLFGVNADIGAGHLILATPAAEMAFFEFSGQDFGDQRTLVIGELYLREQWRFVAAGQPLQGELGPFLRTLTDGPTPAPLPIASLPIAPSQPQRAASPIAPPSLSAPVRPPRPPAPTPIRNVPRPAAPVLSPARAPVVAPVSIPTPNRISQPIPPAPATVNLPPAPVVPLPQPGMIPVAPLNLPQSVPHGGQLQDLIDAAAPGSTLILQRGEYPGPLIISRPLVLEGRESAIWARQGPVVIVASTGVSLHDLDIEVTGSGAESNAKSVALQIDKADSGFELESVRLRGEIAGLGSADGVWKLPRSLDLGEFAPRADNEFRFFVEVPCAAVLLCSVGGIEISPSQIEAGTHQITLRARDIAPDTLLVGQLEVRAPSLVFSFALRGSAQNGTQAARGALVGE